MYIHSYVFKLFDALSYLQGKYLRRKKVKFSKQPDILRGIINITGALKVWPIIARAAARRAQMPITTGDRRGWETLFPETLLCVESWLSPLQIPCALFLVFCVLRKSLSLGPRAIHRIHGINNFHQKLLTSCRHFKS